MKRNILNLDPNPADGGGGSPNISTFDPLNSSLFNAADLGSAPVKDAVAQDETISTAPVTPQTEFVPASRDGAKKDAPASAPVQHPAQIDNAKDVPSSVIPADGSKAKTEITDDALDEVLGIQKPKPPIDPKAKKGAEATTEVKPKDAPPVVETQKRDMTGIAAEHQDAFKRMSNESFNLLAPIYKERVQLLADKQTLEAKLKEAPKTTLPPNYYEHENAFVLDPEFNTAVAWQRDMEIEKNFYKKQLVAAKKGDNVQDLFYDEKQGYIAGARDQNGRFIPNGTRKPTDEDEVELNDKIGQVNHNLQAAAAQINRIKTGFKEKHSMLAKNLEKAQHDYFPFYSDKNGAAYKAHKPQMDMVVNSLPEEVRNQPWVPLLSMSYAVIKFYEQKIAGLEKQLKMGASIKEDARSAGPSGSMVAGPVVPASKVPSDEDFEKATGMKL